MVDGFSVLFSRSSAVLGVWDGGWWWYSGSSTEKEQPGLLGAGDMSVHGPETKHSRPQAKSIGCMLTCHPELGPDPCAG